MEDLAWAALEGLLARYCGVISSLEAALEGAILRYERRSPAARGLLAR